MVDARAMNGDLSDDELDSRNVIKENADPELTTSNKTKKNKKRPISTDEQNDNTYDFENPETEPPTNTSRNKTAKSKKTYYAKKVKLEPCDSNHIDVAQSSTSTSNGIVKLKKTPGPAAVAKRKPKENDEQSDSQSRDPSPKRTRTKSPNQNVTPKSRKSKVSLKRPRSSQLELDIPKVDQKTTALAAGDNEVGQLGMEHSEVKRFRSIEDLPEKLVLCAAGGMHSLFLSDEGKVFSFGCNDDGSLGRPTTEEEENFKPGVVAFDEIKIAKVAAGSIHSVALTTDCRVFIWGNYRDNSGSFGISPDNLGCSGEPMELPLAEPIVDIACGADHTLMLSSMGNIYSMGSAEHGKLGRVRKSHCCRENRRARQVMLAPGIVRIMQKRKRVHFDRVWAGRYCSFARSVDGAIWGCGLNNCHQLGEVERTEHEDNFVYQPVELRAFDSTKKWLQICGGEQHTLALDDNGTVYSMGRVLYGRLGLGPAEPNDPDIVHLTPVAGLENRVAVIAAGDHCSFALDKDGQLWCWGQGTNMLGQGDRDSAPETDIFVPTRVTSKALKDKKVLHVDAGANHALCVACD